MGIGAKMWILVAQLWPLPTKGAICRGFSFVVKANRNFDENFDLEMHFQCYLQSSETLLKQKQLYEIIENVKKTLKYNNYIVNNVIELIHVIDCYSIKSAIQIIQ